jgi:hypothetical protein
MDVQVAEPDPGYQSASSNLLPDVDPHKNVYNSEFFQGKESEPELEPQHGWLTTILS